MTAQNFDLSTGETPKAIRDNIDAVSRMEDGFQSERSLPDRVADAIVRFSGSLKFVLIHVVLYSVWITLNLRAFPFIRPWDPFPFILLNLVVSFEAIFLATFVLIKQNRMSRREDLRAHLDLQINLLAEKEMTLVLQVLQRISDRLGVRISGEEMQELAEETSVDALANQVRESLAEE